MRFQTPWSSVLASAFAVLVCLMARGPSLAQETSRDSATSLVMYRSLFERVLKAYDRDSPVAVVRFMTNFSLHDVTYADGRHEFNVLRPTTYAMNQDLKGAGVHMDGTFLLVKNLQHEAPPLGQVKKTIPVRARWGGDSNYHRFWPFADEKQLGEPVTALAIFQSKTTHILDAELIAPLGKGDLPVFEDFIKHLRTRPVEKITVHEAEALLDSANHLFVWLGLTRLGKLNMLGPRHYYRAILATDSRQSDTLLWEMGFWHGQYDASRQELFNHLALLLKNPKTQAWVANFLRDRFAPNAWAQRRLAEVEQLQQVAKEYRDHNLAELKKRPAALAEMEKFIAWRPQP